MAGKENESSGGVAVLAPQEKTSINYEGLKKEIECSYRVSHFIGTQNGRNSQYPKAVLLAYIDARDVMDLLDEVVGPQNWKDSYREVKGELVCTISIWDQFLGQWVSKEDTGTESNTEAVKGHFSDSFKRAAVKWGVGRFLYSKENIKLNAVAYKEYKDKSGNMQIKWMPCNKDGEILWDVTEAVNQYLNSKKS